LSLQLVLALALAYLAYAWEMLDSWDLAALLALGGVAKLISYRV
jgi:hypothetical protein